MKIRTLTIFFALFFMAICSSFAQNDVNIFTTSSEVQASKMNYVGKTEPLRDLIQLQGLSLEKRKKYKSNKPKEIPNFMGRKSAHTTKRGALPNGPDPVWQNNLQRSVSIPVEPLVNIEGMSSSNFGGTPPDPAGDIGKDFYIQMINGTFFRIFDKEGNAVTGAMNANTLWSPLGLSGLGDPIVLYDQGAERWLLTEFSTSGNNMMMAVSETEDPMGSYYVYNFSAPQFPDYPKFGIWNNAYVVTTNEGGARPMYVMEREKMLNGEDDPGLQRFTIPFIFGGPGFQVATPADWDGILPPPADANPMILRIRDDGWNGNEDRIEIYSIEIDWDNPNNSNVTNQNVPTAPFDSEGCAVNGPGFACIPQPNGDGIDGIPWVIMNRVQYRNFVDYEVMVLNFMVDVTGTTNEISGIRWIELRRMPGEDWTVHQEGTYAPDDGEHRFMGGIAMDGAGNIALAYSVSGPDTSPSLRFTGRRADDPLGEMTVDEFEFGTGDGSINSIRFGDYSAMGIDPTDDRTFWYTGQYKRPNFSWGTKIVAFQVGRDTTDIGVEAMLSPVTADDLTNAEVVEANFTNFGVDTQFVFQVGYSINDEAPIVENINTVLPADSTYNHVFAQSADLSEIGAYNFKIFTSLADDSNVLNDTLRVLIRQLSRFDAGISGIDLATEVVCGETETVGLNLTNFGTQELTSVNINYQLNGGTVMTTPWTGSLEMDETTIVDLEISGLIEGNNTLEVFTSEPNGEVDEVPSNDSFSRSFETTADGVPIAFFFRNDLNPDETSWSLLDSDGTVLYSGGPYIDEPNLFTFEDEFCLHPDSCYTFRVLDTGGDGMTLLDGDYTLTAPDGEVLASLINPDFGFVSNNEFCASGMCLLEAEINLLNDTGIGNGAIIIEAANGSGDLEYSIDGGSSYQDSNIFEDLEEGEYLVVVTDANGCDYVEEVEIMIGTPTLEEELGYKIEVLPNPTEGVFRINIEGMQNVYHLELEILDLTGKRLQHSSMNSYNGVLTGAFSLENAPAGAYFIRFKNSALRELIRVVKQ